ncbi:unnamed protein product [Brachionus calyciflorus]|uniref:NrS-1 polymerase-like helicase domain-containing protein n=1 Tax=Brachionus calyciflorus TaxID=104777 RepID=A0A814IV62_9BILA|nr:unnamed protein product [Brachionus calyciflorus]
MFFLYRFTRSCIAQNTYLIKVPCTGERCFQVYDYLSQFAEKLLVKEAHHGGPCFECYTRFYSNISAKDNDSTDTRQHEDAIELFLNDDANHCRFIFIFIEFKNDLNINKMLDQTNDLINRNANRRVSNGSTINNYLITIPRCNLPKKYIFDGLVNLCNRLAVSKEKHSISYLDSCCKNSSIRKDQIGSNTRSMSFSSQTSQQNGLPRNEQISRERFQQICQEDTIRRSINQYKKQINFNEEDVTLSSEEHDSQTSFINDTALQEEQHEWIHCNSHIHIFAEFLEEYIVDFNKCQRIMKWCAEEFVSNIEPCKSPRNAIKYVTKEDPNPILKNINADECSFHKRMMDWIKANPEYDLFDPFISARPNYYKLITMAHSDYYKKHPIEIEVCRGLVASALDTNNNATKIQVKDWFNDCIRNWRLKFPALYLWGESNTGKTTIIFDWLLHNQVNEIQIFRPTRNCQFAWADFNARQHLVVVMDEFEFSQYNLEEWKNIVEGRYTAVRVKGRSSKTIALKCPIIMISNYPPPTDKPEIINRLKIVKSEKLSNVNLF